MLEPIVRRRSLIGVTALLLAAYVGLAISAILAEPVAFVVMLLVCTLVDVLVERRFVPVVALARQAQFGITHRAVIQVFLMVLLVAISNADREITRTELVLVTAVAMLVPAARIAYMGLLTMVRRRSLLPVETRNVDLPDWARVRKLPRLLDQNVSQRLLLMAVPPIAVGALSIELESFASFFTLAFVYLGLVGTAGGVLAGILWSRASARPTTGQLLELVGSRMSEYRPEVVLYFSGTPSALYQADMWINTLERMRRRTVILVRGRHAVENLARTNLPIICVPGAVDLMNLPLRDARIALYVTNVGNNIHFLREPRVKHVFIGHGDSDKVASFNPFSKAYDQVWVAGRAGRDRYRRAKVGVRDEDIAEVGLPTLDDLERRTGRVPMPTRERPLTVLYLPTWEGWTDDRFQTSLTEMAVPIVEKLLGGSIPIRVLYKPHPLTGTRDPRVDEVDRRIREMLTTAPPATNPVPPVDVDAERRLAKLQEELADQDLTADGERALRGEWGSLFWRANAGRHVVVTGKMPALYDLYDQADIMISDVSSVVSDFIATGKPYIVANPKNVPEDDFREEFPSVRAAYLLNPGTIDVDTVIGSILESDPMAAARSAEREYLLGPDVYAQQRWDAAVEALIAAADKEWDGEHGAGPAAEVDAVGVPENGDVAEALAAAGDLEQAGHAEVEAAIAAGLDPPDPAEP